MTTAVLSLPWAALWCLGLTVVSAIVPWVNAEVIVLSLPAVAGTRGALAVLVLVATIGQMAGKCVIYWSARRGARSISGRLRPALERWQRRFEHRAWAPPAFVLVSSIGGLPPFYLTTLVAGAMKMNFPTYLAAGTAGRLIRFGSLAAGALWALGP